MSDLTALHAYLVPLDEIFAWPGVNEISINEPGVVWVECAGDMTRHEVPVLDLEHLKGLARLVAQSTEQRVSEEAPLLSATLPNGFRVQVVFPPAAEVGRVVFSIRKQATRGYTLEEYEQMGAFADIVTEPVHDPLDATLWELIRAHRIREFLELAVQGKKNIIISGGTSTGKTTFTNAMLRSIPTHERLITVEDAREISLPNHPNRVHLMASKGGQGRANVTVQSLIEACLRLRPDRIIVGELRGAEAFSFLRAINTGHPGSIATLHADTPMMAMEQLTMMVMQAGLGLPQEQISVYIRNVVHIIIQLKRGEGGRRFVSEIYMPPVA